MLNDRQGINEDQGRVATMTSLNLSLPEPMRAFVEAQALKCGYDTVAEYLQALILEAQKHEESERLEAMLLEDLNSGRAEGSHEEYWERFRARLRERHGRANGQ